MVAVSRQLQHIKSTSAGTLRDHPPLVKQTGTVVHIIIAIATALCVQYNIPHSDIRCPSAIRKSTLKPAATAKRAVCCAGQNYGLHSKWGPCCIVGQASGCYRLHIVELHRRAVTVCTSCPAKIVKVVQGLSYRCFSGR